ncbi:hypothetical protein K5I29_06065 [Flavobacterium agricola]|uniref:Integrase catalytic domain-containing protein n=1 Tax=Flavobacterium agricola TaxID=2870839 RepID=A0ABY6M566_9FLAO|nr:hypothetical protein [Flavobacterium agricola]UYW02453.1 hypothetical protein K5I29_06065 [Flavobacterium agricola]
MKNVVKLDHYYHPEELIQTLEKFVENYNNSKYHEAINNLKPEDVYIGRVELLCCCCSCCCKLPQKKYSLKREKLLILN